MRGYGCEGNSLRLRSPKYTVGVYSYTSLSLRWSTKTDCKSKRTYSDRNKTGSSQVTLYFRLVFTQGLRRHKGRGDGNGTKEEKERNTERKRRKRSLLVTKLFFSRVKKLLRFVTFSCFFLSKKQTNKKIFRRSIFVSSHRNSFDYPLTFFKHRSLFCLRNGTPRHPVFRQHPE